jgi:hypothetical protein
MKISLRCVDYVLTTVSMRPLRRMEQTSRLVNGRFRAIVAPVRLHSWLHFGAKILPFLMEKSGSMLVSLLLSDAAESPIGSTKFYSGLVTSPRLIDIPI